MSRCRACNKVLGDHELSEHPELPNELEDLCTFCKQIAYESLLEQTEDELQSILEDLQGTIDSSK